MGIIQFLRYFWRDFRKQKKRATLTVAAIVWGTMSILLLLAFGQGLKEQLDRNQRGLGENIMIVWGGQTSIPYEGLARGRRIRFRPDDVDVIKKSIPEIERIGAEYSRWGIGSNLCEWHRAQRTVRPRTDEDKTRIWSSMTSRRFGRNPVIPENVPSDVMRRNPVATRFS